MHVDGLLTKDEEGFSREDIKAFRLYFKQAGIDRVTFERYKNKEVREAEVDL